MRCIVVTTFQILIVGHSTTLKKMIIFKYMYAFFYLIFKRASSVTEMHLHSNAIEINCLLFHFWTDVFQQPYPERSIDFTLAAPEPLNANEHCLSMPSMCFV